MKLYNYIFLLLFTFCNAKTVNPEVRKRADSIFAEYRNKPSSFEKLYKFSESYYKKTSDPFYLITSCNLKFDYYANSKQSDKLLNAYKEFLRIKNIEHFPNAMVAAKLSITEMYINEKYYNEAFKLLNETDSYLKNKKDEFHQDKQTYNMLHTRLYYTYAKLYKSVGNYKKQTQYLLKAFNSYKESGAYFTKDINRQFLFEISTSYIYNKNIDSMRFYFNQANLKSNYIKNGSILVDSLCVLSIINYSEGKYKESLKNLKLLDKELTLINNDELEIKKYLYYYYYNVYEKLGDNPKQLHYLNLYEKINDEIESKRKPELVSQLLVDENLKQKDSSTKKIITIIIFVSLIILTSIVVYFFFVRKKYKKDKENIDSEIQKVKENASKELVDLAYDNNSIAFYNRFKEIYPNLILNIEKQYPQLTEQDKIFCTYLYLGFSTKEIASIENVSIRTVDSRKYRLRKKCLLDSNEDLYEWIKNLIG